MKRSAKSQGSVITQIGAVKFKEDGTFPAPSLSLHVDLRSCLDKGLTMSQKTLDWRINNKVYFKVDETVKLTDALYRLNAWIGGDEFIYCDPLSFDVPMLAVAFDRCGIRPAWDYHKHRDCKTVEGYSNNLVERTGVEHDALDDAFHQARCLIEAWRLSAAKSTFKDRALRAEVEHLNAVVERLLRERGKYAIELTELREHYARLARSYDAVTGRNSERIRWVR